MPGVAGNVQAGGANPGGHITAGCAQAADLQAKDEREPLNLLSSVLLLQAIRAWLAYFNQSMEREDGFFSSSTLGNA